MITQSEFESSLHSLYAYLSEKFSSGFNGDGTIKISLSQADKFIEVSQFGDFLSIGNPKTRNIKVVVRVKYNSAYQCPVLLFRLWETLMEVDQDTGLEFESDKLVFDNLLVDLVVKRKLATVSNGKSANDNSDEYSDKKAGSLSVNASELDLEEILEEEEDDGSYTIEAKSNHGINNQTISIHQDNQFGNWYLIHPCFTNEVLFSNEHGATTSALNTWWEIYNIII